MVKVIANGQVIAESSNTVVVEGNQYFPPADVKFDVLSNSNTEYICPWKGETQYYHASVGGQEIRDIGWGYPEPKPAASHITGHVAFDKTKVQFEESRAVQPAPGEVGEAQPMESGRQHHGFVDKLKHFVGRKH